MRKMFITTVSVWVGESNGVGVDSLVTTTRHLWVILTYLLNVFTDVWLQLLKTLKMKLY